MSSVRKPQIILSCIKEKFTCVSYKKKRSGADLTGPGKLWFIALPDSAWCFHLRAQDGCSRPARDTCIPAKGTEEGQKSTFLSYQPVLHVSPLVLSNWPEFGQVTLPGYKHDGEKEWSEGIVLPHN